MKSPQYYLHYEIFEGKKSLGATKQEFPADDDRMAEDKAERYIKGQSQRLGPHGQTIKLIGLLDQSGRSILNQSP